MQASTECEKWLQGYKTSLAKTNTARKLAAAKRRAQQKLAGYVPPKPKPKLSPAHANRPRLSREEMLRKFQLACGELPDTQAPNDQLASNDVKPFALPEQLWTGNDGVDLAPGEDTGFLPNMDSPVYTTSNNDFPPDDGGPYSGPPSFTGPGGGGGGGYPGNPGTPGSPGTPGGTSAPGTPGNPGNPDLPGPPVTPVPEPGSIVLMLTGFAGAAGIVRRRFDC